MSRLITSLGSLSVFSLSCVVAAGNGSTTPSSPHGTTTATADPANGSSTATVTPMPNVSANAPVPGGGCTRMGCTDALSVIVAGGDRLAKGKYVIEVMADGKTGKCTFAAPGFADRKDSSCEGDLELEMIAFGVGKGSPESLSEIRVRSSPVAVTITVTRDGKRVGEAKLTPAYSEVRPNGPGCDPSCKSASEKLVIK